jgi:putative membrane protein
MGGSFAMMSGQLALTRTRNPNVINFAKAEIAERVQVATALGAAPGSTPLRPDHADMMARLDGVPAGGGF